jgi:hypothetical protein
MTGFSRQRASQKVQKSTFAGPDPRSRQKPAPASRWTSSQPASSAAPRHRWPRQSDGGSHRRVDHGRDEQRHVNRGICIDYQQVIEDLVLLAAVFLGIYNKNK